MRTKTRDPLHPAGLCLGVGLGGFIDGIVLHQILQWHHMVCTTATCQPRDLAEFQRQTLLDGIFHLGMWAVTFAGIVLLFRRMRHAEVVPSGWALAGSMLIGWGGFNVVEGIVDHHLLRIHHVLAGSRYEFAADVIFLVVSLLLIIGGTYARRCARARLP